MRAHMESPVFSQALLISTTAVLSCLLFSAINQRPQQEKETHIRCYFHENYTGPSPTAMKIVSSPSPMGLGPRYIGDMVVLNNPLTDGPSRTSRPVGTAQGFAVRVSENGLISELAMHLMFEEGEFKGSSVQMLSRIDLSLPERESPIVGGTGRFKRARGHVLSRNVEYNFVDGGIAEFDVYVIHK